MKHAALALAGAAMALVAPASAADPITGRWITEDRDAVITIAPCGANLCGKISKFLVAPPQGVNQRDVNNPDKSKRSRKLLGTPVLTSFSEDGDLWRGRIYDPKSGKDYRSVIRRTSASKLEVKGCLGPFCQTQNWTRAN
jgi:uncharacterized protein (DUF2147 family)